MAHTHKADEGYFLDQIFAVALCGALGGIAVLLYFVKTSMLNDMLDAKFHPYLLVGGIALLVLVVIRAVALWKLAGEVGQHTHAHHHGHDHAHPHDHAQHHHDHEHCDHHHDDCGHEHQHEHHDHDHGHDHGWDPWRYMVLMLPVVLFLLGLPNKGLRARHKDVNFEADFAPQTAASTLGLLAPPSGAGPVLAASLIYPGRNDRYGDGFVTSVDEHDMRFSVLEEAGYDAGLRYLYNNKAVTVIGEFTAREDSDRFGLVRYRRNCCAADAIPLHAVIMISPNWQGERLDVKERQGKWVKVTARLFFLKKRGTDDFIPALIVFPSKEKPPNTLVEVIPRPANPFTQ